jgi:hypothetical protein
MPNVNAGSAAQNEALLELSARAVGRAVRNGLVPHEALLDALLSRWAAAGKFAGMLSADFKPEDAKAAAVAAVVAAAAGGTAGAGSGGGAPAPAAPPASPSKAAGGAGGAASVRPRGPLAGVPFVASANMDLAGRATTAGSGAGAPSAAATTNASAAGALQRAHCGCHMLRGDVATAPSCCRCHT